MNNVLIWAQPFRNVKSSRKWNLWFGITLSWQWSHLDSSLLLKKVQNYDCNLLFQDLSPLWQRTSVLPVTLITTSQGQINKTGVDKMLVCERLMQRGGWEVPPLQRQNPPEHIRAKWPLQMRAVINHARTHTHPHTDTRVYMPARGHVDEVTHNHLLLSLVSKLSPPAVNQKAGIKK